MEMISFLLSHMQTGNVESEGPFCAYCPSFQHKELVMNVIEHCKTELDINNHLRQYLHVL